MHMLKPMKMAAWIGCVTLLLTGCGNRVEELRLQGIDLVEKGKYEVHAPVCYTHVTLPTNREVSISVVAVT